MDMKAEVVHPQNYLLTVESNVLSRALNVFQTHHGSIIKYKYIVKH